MSAPEPPRPAPGWYPNPEGTGQRYWDGQQWTNHFHDPRVVKRGDSLWQNFRKLPPLGQAGVTVGLLVLAIALATSGGTEDANDKSEQASGSGKAEEPTRSPAPPPDVVLVFRSPSYGAEVRRDFVTIRGLVRPANSRVRVAGRLVDVSFSGAWKRRVKLRRGTNEIPVKAAHAGHTTKDTELVLERVLSASERRAIAEERKAKFKADSVEIPYNQLNKNPDRYAGKKVVYTGKILQIQESGGEGFMLLSVTDEGYDIWTDNIWVNYFREIDSAEDDVIKIYGVVKGSRSYETQIGGETYVPEIDARYVEE